MALPRFSSLRAPDTLSVLAAFLLYSAAAFQLKPSHQRQHQSTSPLFVLSSPVDELVDLQQLQPLVPKKQKRRSGTVANAKLIKPTYGKSQSMFRRQRASTDYPQSSATTMYELPQTTDDITEELKRLVSAAAEASVAEEVAAEAKGRQTLRKGIPALRNRRPRTTRQSAGAALAAGESLALPVPPTTATTKRKASRKQKALPQKEGTRKRGRPRKSTKVYAASSNNDLSRFYKTELLSPVEEYTYGAQVQFMMTCEEVHEGLAVRLSRLPTLREWAAACGYTVPDPKYKLTEADEMLRPVGSEDMFADVDPTMFVGNGQLGATGPGRGRGRAKKVPDKRLKDCRADKLVHPSLQVAKSAPHLVKSAPHLVNRGTIRDFLEMIRTGREAKQSMVSSNMRLVVSIAKKYSNVGVSLHDLVQEGSLGLSRAAEKFDPGKGFKFSTYASWWIQQAVFRSIAYHSRTIRLPVHIHNMLNRIHRVRTTLTRDLGRAPTNEEMASKLGMTLQKFNKLLRLTKRSISLDLPKYKSNPKDLGHESDDILCDTIDASSVNEIVLDDNAPEKLVDHSLFLDDLKDMLEVLEKDERLVLCARYGLSDGITRTVTAVSAQMRQSKAWVRSLECRALRKLRRPWYEQKLREHERSLTSD